VRRCASANARSEGPGFDAGNGEVSASCSRLARGGKDEGKTKTRRIVVGKWSILLASAPNAAEGLNRTYRRRPFPPLMRRLNTVCGRITYGRSTCIISGRRYGTGPVQLRPYSRHVRLRCAALILLSHKVSASFLPEAQLFSLRTISAVGTCRVPASALSSRSRT
jgi:hypothetical protein